MDVLDLAWIAGFVDGEGCFTLLHHRQRSGRDRLGPYVDRWYPRILITQCHRGILEEIADTLDVPAKIYGNTRGENKTVYNLHIQSSGLIEHVCETLIPYLRLKKDQAKFLVQALSIPPRERQTLAGVLSAMK